MLFARKCDEKSVLENNSERFVLVDSYYFAEFETTKKLIFIYGEDDPWTGAAIPDPTNPNVKKYIIPHGYHSDEFDEFEWYPGGKEMGQQILDDIKAIIDQK